MPPPGGMPGIGGVSFLGFSAFSIAMTAWSANVSSSSICLTVNGRTVLRLSTRTPIGLPSDISKSLTRYLTDTLDCSAQGQLENAALKFL